MFTTTLVAPDTVSFGLFRDTTRSLLRSMRRPYSTVLATAVTLNTLTSGKVNGAISNSSLAGLSEFPSFATLFDEFFITRFVVRFAPVSRYQYPVNALPTLGVTSAGLTLTALHHGVPGYSTSATAMENATTSVLNTSDPWSYTWSNVERPSVSTVVAPETSAATPTQGWCLTSATPAALYTGNVQLLTDDVIGPGGTMITIGRLYVLYHVMFRLRA